MLAQKELLWWTNLKQFKLKKKFFVLVSVSYNCYCSGRRRRSISDLMDESQLYHVVHGPFTFKQEELNKDEGKWSVTGLLAMGQEFC